MEKSLKDLAIKFSIAAAAFGASLIIAPNAFAATADNSNTGADSTNTSSVDVSNSVNIVSENNAYISNNISINANTGGNSADKNTGDGSVTTGDINGSVTIINDVNSNSLNTSKFHCSGVCKFSANVNASNSHTGADSENNASVSVDNDVTITQTNEQAISNSVGADLNTGENSADKNTGDGSVRTGDIKFTVKVKNSGNTNVIGGPQNPPVTPSTPTPSKPVKKPEEGQVLAASRLPNTGGKLPIMPSLALILAGLMLKSLEEKLRARFLPERH